MILLFPVQVKGESKYVYTVKGTITKKGEKKPLAGLSGICNGQISLQWPKGAGGLLSIIRVFSHNLFDFRLEVFLSLPRDGSFVCS